MIPDNIRNSKNPYYPLTSKLSQREFYGRKKEQKILIKSLEEYEQTSKINNILVCGNKSIGKSSLLNIFSEKLSDYNFIIYRIELQRDGNRIDEFEFFKDIIDDIFLNNSPSDGNFLNPEQSEIWFSLTSGNYQHESNFLKRKLSFATSYANHKKGIPEKLSYKSLERDFLTIIEELYSKDKEVAGFVLIIDEFQVLSTNPFIIDVLRQLSEQIDSLMVIGAGLPSLLSDPVYEKFNRVSQPIDLKGMSTSDIFDLIFNPLQQLGDYTRYEVQRWFNPHTIKEIIERSGGNPLHIKILCSTMFEYIKQDPSHKHFEINANVMNNVMEYYSRISENSRKISLSLESCSRYQLESFKLLYKYEGFSIRAALLLELAFTSINKDNEEQVRLKLMSAFGDLFDFGLFEFSRDSLSLDDLKNMSTNELSQIEYRFIGDPIDKLYASYFFELTMNQQLYDNNGKSFEDMLANRFGSLLDLSILGTELPENYAANLSMEHRMMLVLDGYILENCQGQQVVEDLDKLINLSKANNNEENDKNINALSTKHGLHLPSFIAKFMNFKGYYVIISDITVKGKRKYIYNLIPVTSKVNEIIEVNKEVTDVSMLNISFDDYMVRVNYIYVLWLPNIPLIKIVSLELEDAFRNLISKVKERDFDTAVQIAHGMCQKSFVLYEGHVVTHIDLYNNYGFCLINIDKVPESIDVLTNCSDKSMISRVNLSFAYYLQGNLDNAKEILSKMVRKKMGLNTITKFMHLAINHAEIKRKNIIIEDCDLYNVSAWNAALISAQLNEDVTIINSFLKKVVKKNHEIINKRVESWVKYYLKQFADAVILSNEVLNNSNTTSEIKDAVKEDINIFTKSLSRS